MRKYLPLASLLVLTALSLAQAGEPIFVPVKIDGPVHDPANHSYWYGPFSECASVLDMDGDGDLDIASGRNWYEAPQWIKHENFRDGAETNGPETDDNSEFALDVNRDGRTDVVSSGWMRLKGAFWYENPGGDGKWTGRRIHSANSMEGVIHGDIDGDGDQDILCNHWNLVKGQGMTWLEAIDRAPWFVEHVIGTEGEKHGNGMGDINGDGRVDIVTPLGWWEAPPKPATDKWTFHADFDFGTSASHPVLVHDCNGDGRNDIIIGAAHDYGLFWYEQTAGAGGKPSFRKHAIETGYGGFHTMALGDLNGDGKDDLVTGKRLYPHHGRDISAYEPVFAFWYDIAGGKFERHILAFNHLPWLAGQHNQNPPPNQAIGVGMKINIADMDGDGRNDVVLAGKGGLYIMYNKADTPTPKPEQILPPEDVYPSWVAWSRPKTAADEFVPLFDGAGLDHWQVPSESWVVENGVLSLKDRTDGKMRNENYLWTKQKYGDFILELDYKVPADRANSGVFIRTENLQDPVQTGIEVQVGNAPADRPLNNGSVGGLYDLVAPRKDMHKPGEWNHYRITCKGGYISVMLNGQQTAEALLDVWTTARQNPDGSRNKFRRPLKDFAREGYIGFQDHGSPASYRNIRIRRLGN